MSNVSSAPPPWQPQLREIQGAAQPLALTKITPAGEKHLAWSCSEGSEPSRSKWKQRWDFIPNFDSTAEPWCLPGALGWRQDGLEARQSLSLHPGGIQEGTAPWRFERREDGDGRGALGALGQPRLSAGLRLSLSNSDLFLLLLTPPFSADTTEHCSRRVPSAK